MSKSWGSEAIFPYLPQQRSLRKSTECYKNGCADSFQTWSLLLKIESSLYLSFISFKSVTDTCQSWLSQLCISFQRRSISKDIQRQLLSGLLPDRSQAHNLNLQGRLFSLPSKELDFSFAVTAASWMPFVSTVSLYFAVIPELPFKLTATEPQMNRQISKIKEQTKLIIKFVTDSYHFLQ